MSKWSFLTRGHKLDQLKNPPTHLGGLLVFWRWILTVTPYVQKISHTKNDSQNSKIEKFRKNRKKCPQDEMSAKIEKLPSGQKCPKNDAIVKRGLNLNLKLKINFCLDFRSCEKVSSRVLDHFLFQHIEFNNL